MNIHFTILVRISNRLHEFNFRKRSDTLYDGDTGDERSDRHYFKMVKEETQWRMQYESLPDWIKKNKMNIGNAFALRIES